MATRARVRPRRFTARTLPLLLLVVSLGVATVGAVSAHRLQRSHRHTATALLRDYAAFASWSFSQHAADRLSEIVHYPLHPVGHPEPGDRPMDPAVLLSRALARQNSACDSLRCRPAYVFRVGVDGRDFRSAGAPVAPDERERVGAAVSQDLRLTPAAEGEVRLLHAGRGGPGRHIAYLVRDHGADGRFVYGFGLEPERHEEAFRQILQREAVLPPTLTHGKANTDVLALRVVDPSGRALFSSGGALDEELHAEQPLPPQFGGLVVKASVRPEMAEQLVIGGLPRSRAPWMLLVFGLSALLAAVAFSYLRRESQLARLRSDFVSSVSHELRTPLAQARLFLETLRLRRYDTEEEREWMMGCIERETTRLAHLVENVLQFSRGEQGVAPAERDLVELGPEIREIVLDFAPLAEAAETRIRTHVAPDLFASIERGAFRQMLLNLLDNATKYGARTQTVTVVAERLGSAVRITVEDEGPGVKEEERELIWEPFRRGGRSVGTAAVGSGIGLSVVREIVEQHGGSARVESAAGGGARFILSLPAEAPPTSQFVRTSAETDLHGPAGDEPKRQTA